MENWPVCSARSKAPVRIELLCIVRQKAPLVFAGLFYLLQSFRDGVLGSFKGVLGLFSSIDMSIVGWMKYRLKRRLDEF